MRLYGEFEQICRKAYNRIESVESKQRSAETMLQMQQRVLECSELDQEKNWQKR